MDPAHQPVRVWWAPWRRRCSCGARRWPCPDTAIGTTPPPAYWLSIRNTKAHWIDEPPPGTPANGAEPGPVPDDNDAPSEPLDPEQERRRRSRQRRRWPW